MRWLPAILLVILGAGIYFAIRFVLAAPRSPFNLPGSMPALPPNVNLRLTNLSLTGRKEGKPAWTMQADRMDTTRDHNELDFAGNIHAELLQEGVSRATVRASTAHYSNASKLLIASGSVVCVAHPPKEGEGEDIRMESDRVTWNIGERRIVCPNLVRVVQGEYQATGEQLTVDLKTRNVTLRNFMITLPVNEDGTLPLGSTGENSRR
jgi:LPS export ABC transporter protein LptC